MFLCISVYIYIVLYCNVSVNTYYRNVCNYGDILSSEISRLVSLNKALHASGAGKRRTVKDLEDDEGRKHCV